MLSDIEEAVLAGNMELIHSSLASNSSLTRLNLDDALELAFSELDREYAIDPLISAGATVNRYALYCACERNDLTIFEAFLSTGWNINSTSTGLTALRMVIQDEACVQWFLKHGADPNLPSEDGITPFAAAARNPDPKAAIAILKLLIMYGAEPDSRALFFTIGSPRFTGGRPVLEFLLELGMDVNAVLPEHVSRRGRTLLVQAVDYDSEDLVRYLLDKGADKNLNPGGGWTVTRFAESKGRKGIIDLLSRYS